MDGLEAQADIWAEEIALVNIVKAIGDASRGLTDRMPSDVRAGFINRQEAQIDALVRQAYLEGFYRGGASRKEYDDAQVAAAATQLDALSARVKELEAEGDQMAEVLASPLADKVIEYSDRATRLQQERDEAYERLKPFAEAAADLDDANPDRMEIWEAPCAMQITAGHLRAASDLVHQIASGPDKEKP